MLKYLPNCSSEGRTARFYLLIGDFNHGRDNDYQGVGEISKTS